jgi:hypothetical protein
MVHEALTMLPPDQILARAKQFFAERVPHHAAYPELEGAGYLTLRGQGGEEIALAVSAGPEGTRVRGSTPIFDPALARFLHTLPRAAVAAS